MYPQWFKSGTIARECVLKALRCPEERPQIKKGSMPLFIFYMGCSMPMLEMAAYLSDVNLLSICTVNYMERILVALQFLLMLNPKSNGGWCERVKCLGMRPRYYVYTRYINLEVSLPSPKEKMCIFVKGRLLLVHWHRLIDIILACVKLL